MLKKHVHAVVGVIYHKDDRNKVLLAQRQKHQSYAGYWEFPGGKVEENEDINIAIKRELKEELNIELLNYNYLTTIDHEYVDHIVKLEVFIINRYSNLDNDISNNAKQQTDYGPAKINFKNIEASSIGNEGQAIVWCDPKQLLLSSIESIEQQISPLLEASHKILNLL